MSKFSVIRKHEIHCGHRVYGHGGKCAHLHGHSYIIHFYAESIALNSLGMVVDFGVIKSTVCQWLEEHFDHRMLIWTKDPLLGALQQLDPMVVAVNFNPTAENIAHYLVTQVCPSLLSQYNIEVVKVIVEETTKCSASFSLE